MAENMNDAKWNERMTAITEWMTPDIEASHPNLSVINTLKSVGDSDPSVRNTYWATIRTTLIGTGIDEASLPLPSGGGAAADYGEYNDPINNTVSGYRRACIAHWNSDKVVQISVLRHGRSGGGTYPSASAYAKDEAKKLRASLVKAYNAMRKGETDTPYHIAIEGDLAVLVPVGGSE